LVEMESNRESSFCCGGGGGGIWLDVKGDVRINSMRFSHVEKTKAQTVVTSCPFCKLMLDEPASKAQSDRIQVKDIAELVLEAL